MNSNCRALLVASAFGLALAASPGVPIFDFVRSAPASIVAETHDVLDFEYQQTGANEEEAVRLASIRAVRATLGRLLHSDYTLQGRDMIEPYIQKNWARFTASTYVLERRMDRDGFGVRIRVQTYPEVMHRDLREKKFLRLARANPAFSVFVAESLNGAVPASPSARQVLALYLEREQSEKVLEPKPTLRDIANLNVVEDSATFQDAVQATLRAGGDIIITGRIDSVRAQEAKIYYDTIDTYETSIRLQAVNALTGAPLAAVDTVVRSSESSTDAAKQGAIRSAVEQVVPGLISKAKQEWNAGVSDEGQFSVMFSDMSPEETDMMIRYLDKSLGMGTRCTLKSLYGGVAILNVETPRLLPALDRSLAEFHAFDMRVTDRKGKRIVVEVRH